MSNSTHKVEVFRVERLEPHPNADKLSIMHVFDNYQAVVGKSDYKPGDLACYVPPDNILPDKPEYAFLKGHFRIKAMKLRGVLSQGLVLAAPAGSYVGQDVAEALGITHYVPKPNSGSKGAGGGGNHGATIADPNQPGPEYDIDSWFRYGSLIPEGTNVEITEKLDGANTRASYQDGKFWMGSRNHYRQEDETGLFWRVFHKNPWLKRLCKQNPGCVIYGETFGNIQALKYGMKDTEDFRVFDIWTPYASNSSNPSEPRFRFMDWSEKVVAMQRAMIPSKWEGFTYALKRVGEIVRLYFLFDESCLETKPWTPPVVDWEDHYVPVIKLGMYTKEKIEECMNGKTLIPGADHLREGIVIKPLEEMWDPRIGRLILKAVSPEYLEKA